MKRQANRLLIVAALALLGLGSAWVPGSGAQDASPVPGAPAGGAAVEHPAHIHRGTCAALDPNPAFPLADVSAPTGTTAAGAAAAIPVERSVARVDVALADLLTEPFAINVHESAANLERYVACGDVGGVVADGTLAIGLREQSASGYAGVASLAATDDGGTTVTLFLARDLSEAGAATAPTNAATVQILDFAFEPAALEVKVGTTVTWVNDGPTAHTSTAYAEGGQKLWDSAILQQGGTYSYTFDEPGAFDYLCTLHPSMKAHIDVVS